MTILQLAQTIVRLSGRRLAVVADPLKPEGASRRTVDTAKARLMLGFRPSVRLEEGLRATIASYEAVAHVPAGEAPVRGVAPL